MTNSARGFWGRLAASATLMSPTCSASVKHTVGTDGSQMVRCELQSPKDINACLYSDDYTLL